MLLSRAAPCPAVTRYQASRRPTPWSVRVAASALVSLRGREGVKVHRQRVHHRPVSAVRRELKRDVEVGLGGRRRQEGRGCSTL